MANVNRKGSGLFSPRWTKVFRDLLVSKGRSLLVVLTIAVGVAGIGAVGQAAVVLNRAMSDTLRSAQPAQITLSTALFHDKDILDRLLELPDVSGAEASAYYRVRLSVSKNGDDAPAASAWQNFDLYALPDFKGKRIDRISPELEGGGWPPGDGRILIEWLTAENLQASVHDNVWIETPDSELHRLRVDGTVWNSGKEAVTVSKVGSGFITMDTLEKLDLPSDYNLITIRVQGEGTDMKQLEAVAAASRELLKDHSIEVKSTWIPEAGKHWASDIVNSMTSILQSLGALALIAASFLVVNTMLAILGSQLRQIGVMQVLGAEPGSLVRMYLTQACLFGVLALSVGLPVGMIGSKGLTNQSTWLLNFTSEGYDISYYIVAVQVVIGLGLPLLSAYIPVVKGTRISVREAISGIPSGMAARSRMDRMVEGIRGLPRPLLLSLRNTFRKKGRLLLTLASLGLGGAIVISVFSVQASLLKALDQSLRYTEYDIRVATAAPQDQHELSEIALSVPGVVRTEQWGLLRAYRVFADGSESSELTVEALPADSGMIHPQMLQGEWLAPGEDDTLVFDSYLLRKHPGLNVGDTIALKIGDKTKLWRIKGFSQKMVGEPVCYITKEGMRRVLDDDSQASLVQVITQRHDQAAQAAVESKLKQVV
ncbi:ABC transporter permease [Paenibacillus hamazuiensis]|uniref:ABC transporter permease n=1 Tax=Paenibacillus hamazuiensis TaxID=2936508 RepID=UPI00200D652B|nr:ABC transporter permease [Paenibacillus hamazuiensis]